MLGVIIVVYALTMYLLGIFLAKKWDNESEEVIVVASVFWPITLILFLLRVIVDLVYNEITLRFRKK